MQLFYNPKLDGSISQFYFDSLESKHITKVLRKSKDDILHITDGKGHIFKAKILDPDVKKCKAQIIQEKRIIPTKYKLHIGIAPTKMNDRFEWFLEKATEIGIHEITPILCQRSVRKQINPERYEKIIQSAMKQSGQAYLPQLNPMIPFEKFAQQALEPLKFMAHCEESEKYELKRRVAADKSVVVLIGPEGDFTPEEIAIASHSGFLPVSLGNNRLRTETAGVVVCSTIALIN